MTSTTIGRVLGLGTGITALLATLPACGPSHVKINPSDVVNVSVRPASGQLLYCPGDAFQIEVVAKMKDGTSCSTLNAERGCLGQRDVVIDPDDVRIEGSSGVMRAPREQLVWFPDPNPLATAATGLALRGWIQSVTKAGLLSKSMLGESELKPVYECQKERVFAIPQRGSSGEHGVAGPNLSISVTALSTPFYPNAALIRIEDGAGRTYIISPSADQPVRILSVGQNGAPGPQGTPGEDGKDGEADTTNNPCAKGGDGTNGTDGLEGGPGGDGGPGGSIRILLDEASADKLRGRVYAVSVGGEPGPGGLGGPKGKGGTGGLGGPISADCTDNKGKDGQDGKDGEPGPNGRRGANGPPPSFGVVPRDSLFATELPTLQQIEATPAKR